MASLIGDVPLGARTAPSRVLFGPHETNLGRGRAFSERHVAYYRRRAEGGAGVVVTEIASVHDSDWPYERAPLAADCGHGWADVVTACRPLGTLVLAGLGHAGSQGSSAYSQQALWAPSRVPDVASRELPLELDEAQIGAVVAGFAAATGVAVESDVDGVEVNAGQFSLLRQFLSGLTNQRGDRWGEDKATLLREVLTAVRRELGDRVLGLRLSCDELAPWAGITPDHAAEHVKGLAGMIDYLAVVRGSAMGTSATRPDLHTEPGFTIDLCRAMRAVAGFPVVLQGSVVDPGQAQWALDDGVADLVEMTRAQIADPDLVAKVRAGTPVRPCTLDNARCLVRDNRNPLVSCSVEPRSGHETTDPPIEPAVPHDGRALVVGGGPAGLEAARVLALRGYRVRLAERSAELGGALRLAALAGGRARLGTFADWLIAQVGQLGVDVHLGTEVTGFADAPEAVVLATGSKPGLRGYRTAPGAQVVGYHEFYAGGASLPDGPVVVFDPVGGPIGVGTAELAAAGGRPVALLTQDHVVGTLLAITGDLADANRRVQQAGVTPHKSSLLREVHSGHAVLENRFTGKRIEIECALLIDCGHRLPDHTLDHPGAIRAGDCVAPRTVHDAVLEGRRAALALASRTPAAVAR
ncbi:mycofactocin system FadH/OYE family oxidoreductase 1 [Amycolatopsis sp. H20-H5]|uniref:mycofactocin system FadH/OYE family oxidoreductase 1 n=1 Tax=Amycolatopsis sp. H20-H5 TaxID=3046309 RepID=UPI002DB790A5|nr:mycofactocin system FadH/OYE family oxidoreductase 1 [Amycolatopsis sp. H20-H5]MEC3977303.1 mycofactocin system FadH/OYE family oxidoreductase 1 [Amycolatopsis sp. H20-H5]